MLIVSPQAYICRRPLFPGTSCIPLSPTLGRHSDSVLKEPPFGDQIRLICEVLGLPKESDLDFITNPDMRFYVMSLDGTDTGPNLRQRFFYASATGIDLLTKMLAFNPKNRITAEEALKHPYFDDVRSKSTEIKADHKMEEMAENSKDYVSQLLEFIKSRNSKRIV